MYLSANFAHGRKKSPKITLLPGIHKTSTNYTPYQRMCPPTLSSPSTAKHRTIHLTLNNIGVMPLPEPSEVTKRKGSLPRKTNRYLTQDLIGIHSRGQKSVENSTPGSSATPHIDRYQARRPSDTTDGIFPRNSPTAAASAMSLFVI